MAMSNKIMARGVLLLADIAIDSAEVVKDVD
jgi:hypothetical protein